VQTPSNVLRDSHGLAPEMAEEKDPQIDPTNWPPRGYIYYYYYYYHYYYYYYYYYYHYYYSP
jgi:hypothetical protein